MYITLEAMELDWSDILPFLFAVAAMLLTFVRVEAQGIATADSSRKWEITDNSFLVEEAFNQEAGVVQNIFEWTLGRHGTWNGSFTQEWPAPGTKHQLSYSVPFASTGDPAGLGAVMLHHRYQR